MGNTVYIIVGNEIYKISSDSLTAQEHQHHSGVFQTFLGAKGGLLKGCTDRIQNLEVALQHERSVREEIKKFTYTNCKILRGTS